MSQDQNLYLEKDNILVSYWSMTFLKVKGHYCQLPGNGIQDRVGGLPWTLPREESNA